MKQVTIFDVAFLRSAFRRLIAPFAFLFLILYDVRFAGLIAVMVALALFPKPDRRGW